MYIYIYIYIYIYQYIYISAQLYTLIEKSKISVIVSNEKKKLSNRENRVLIL